MEQRYAHRIHILYLFRQQQLFAEHQGSKSDTHIQLAIQPALLRVNHTPKLTKKENSFIQNVATRRRSYTFGVLRTIEVLYLPPGHKAQAHQFVGRRHQLVRPLVRDKIFSKNQCANLFENVNINVSILILLNSNNLNRNFKFSKIISF